MPVITIKTGITPAEKKKQLIEKLTSVASEVTGISEKSFIVIVEEWENDSIGVGGQTLTERLANQ